MHYLFIIISV